LALQGSCTMSASMDSWRSKLNTKYSKQDIEQWDVKLKAQLKDLKVQPDNRRCFDCEADDVTWASPKLGIFICMICSDVHRAAGAHITCVKNFNTYLWGPDEVALMKAVGNKRARALYGQEVVSPQTDKNTKVAYCTRKYGNPETQQLVAKEVAAAKEQAQGNQTAASGGAHVKQSSPAQSQVQPQFLHSAAANFFDDFFQEPPVTATKPEASGYTAASQAMPEDDWFVPMVAPAPPGKQEIKLSCIAEVSPVTSKVGENNTISMDDFLAACNPAPVVQKVPIKATTETDVFAGWESWD